MFLKDFLYICLSWPAALAHGKIEENSVNSGVFKGLGRSRNGTFFDARAGTHCKNTEKNNVFE